MLSDCHVHLDRYEDARVSHLMTRARAAGLGVVITAGSDLASSLRAATLARQHDELLAGAGLHPLSLTGAEGPGEVDALARLCRREPRVVCISEVGLDYSNDRSPPRHQRRVFAALASLAAELDLPVVFHDRAPMGEAVTVLQEAGAGRLRGAVHYFTGEASLARSYLEAGLLISVGKPLLVPEREELRAAVRGIPRDRLLLETDTYPLPGRRTEPADVRLVADGVAALWGTTRAEVASQTWQNLAALLGRGSR